MKAHEFYGSHRTGCRECGQMPDHPLHQGVEPKIEHYTHEELREAVGILLQHIDKLLPESIHYYGQTPDWFVAAASMSCNIPSNGTPCIELLRELENIDPTTEKFEFTVEVP